VLLAGFSVSAKAHRRGYFSERESAMKSLSSRFAARTRSLIGAAVPVFLLFMGTTAPSVAQTACNRITFAAGTEWSLCWQLRELEGLIVLDADYRDNGGLSRRVVSRGSIAEVHVPYHPGAPRYLDLAFGGLGGSAVDLAASECDGVLVDPKVCREVHNRGHAWKWEEFFQIGQEVTYWISSQIGNYNYITRWTFRDDGSVSPELGFTGRLQKRETEPAYARFGSRLNPQGASDPLFGINHMHNVYWRLDLDIAGPGNDAVNTITQVRHTGSSPEPGVDCTVAGTCHINRHTRLGTEVVERLAPFKTWHQIDRGTSNEEGRRIGYEIIPEGNQLWTGPRSEPWAAGELYVTRFNNCEMLAVRNREAGDPSCSNSAPHVRAMVNGQAVDGANIVLWYKAHFQHVVRDEDEPNMAIEHVGLELQPRSWREINTLE
jgi:primary-amine oxidase